MTTPEDAHPGGSAGGGSGARRPTGESTVGAPKRRVFRGRRRANTGGEGGPRSRRTVISHTEAEWARVSSIAAAMGISVPRLYERALRAGDVVAAAHMQDVALQLGSARRGVAGGLINLNQIAHVANTTGEVSPEQWEFLQSTARELRAQYDHLNEVLEGLPEAGDL